MHTALCCSLVCTLLTAPVPDPLPPSAGYLGITANLARGAEEEGVEVIATRTGSPAQKAGIVPGDVIVKFGELRVREWSEFTDHIKTRKPGTNHRLLILRKEKIVEVSVEIAERPPFAELVSDDPPRVPGRTVRGGELDTDLYRNEQGNYILRGRGSITGDYEQGDWALLGIDPEDAEEPAFVEIGGNVSLAGTLYVRTLGEPQVGDRIEIIRGAKSIKGCFAKTILPELAAGLKWQIHYDDLKRARDLDGDGKHDVTLLVVVKK